MNDKRASSVVSLAHDASVLNLPDGDILLVRSSTGEWVKLDAAAKPAIEAISAGRWPTASADAEPVEPHRWVADLAQEGYLVSGDARPPESSIPPLLSLHVEITNACNLRCRHCYLSSGAAKQHELTRQEVLGLIDQIVSMGAEKVSISGGEPFLVPWLAECLVEATARGLRPYVFTNGTLLGPEWIARLKEIGTIVTQISIEGPDEATHDAIRGVGSFRRMADVVERLVEAGLGDNIILFGTLSSENIHKVRAIVELARAWRVRRLRFTQINRQGRAEDEWQGLQTSPEQWIEYGHTIRQLWQEYPELEIIGNVYGGLKVEEPGEFPRMACKCGQEPRINCQGDVFPCQMFVDPKFSLGNIRSMELRHILACDGLTALRRTIATRSDRNATCGACCYKLLCGGGCPGHAVSDFSDIDHEDEFCAVRRWWFKEFLASDVMDS